MQRGLPAITVVTLSNMGDSRQAVLGDKGSAMVGLGSDRLVVLMASLVGRGPRPPVRALFNPSALRLRALRDVDRALRGVNHRE